MNRKNVVMAASSGPFVAPNVYGVKGWTLSNKYATVGNAGNRGSAAGYWLAGYGRLLALPTVAETLAGPFDNSGKGNCIRTTGPLNFQFLSALAAGNNWTTSPSRVLAAPDVGITHAWIGIYTGLTDLKVRLIFNKVEIGAPGSVATGYTLPGVSFADGLGYSSNGAAPATSWSLGGSIGGGGVPDAGEIDAWFSTLKSSGSLIGIPGKTDHSYPVGPLAPPATLATLVDTIGGQNMTRLDTGGLLVGEYYAPTWGY